LINREKSAKNLSSGKNPQIDKKALVKDNQTDGFSDAYFPISLTDAPFLLGKGSA
jgi:hypothetical protein